MRYAHLLLYIYTLEFLEGCSTLEVSVNSESFSISGPFGAVSKLLASPLLKEMLSERESSGNLCVRCGYMRGWEGKDVERRVDGRVGGGEEGWQGERGRKGGRKEEGERVGGERRGEAWEGEGGGGREEGGRGG